MPVSTCNLTAFSFYFPSLYIYVQNLPQNLSTHSPRQVFGKIGQRFEIAPTIAPNIVRKSLVLVNGPQEARSNLYLEFFQGLFDRFECFFVS